MSVHMSASALACDSEAPSSSNFTATPAWFSRYCQLPSAVSTAVYQSGPAYTPVCKFGSSVTRTSVGSDMSCDDGKPRANRPRPATLASIVDGTLVLQSGSRVGGGGLRWTDGGASDDDPVSAPSSPSVVAESLP